MMDPIEQARKVIKRRLDRKEDLLSILKLTLEQQLLSVPTLGEHPRREKDELVEK